jgi:hypothetical protein
MRWQKDLTGRFPQRPHWDDDELDHECENLINDFFRGRYGRVTFPISTEALTVLIEQHVADLDTGADLSDEGPDVEGVTYFMPSGKPRVKIRSDIAYDDRRENRLRTTLTHELGHVKLHAFLWVFNQLELTREKSKSDSPKCKRDNLLTSGTLDWMEWQAGYASGAYLMPITPLRALIHGYRDETGSLAVITEDSLPAAELIARVQEAFAVSADAARVRLLQKKYIVRGTTAASASLFP